MGYRPQTWWRQIYAEHTRAGDYLDTLCMVKILFPKRFSEIELKDDFWKIQKNALAQLRSNGQWEYFAKSAAAMKILAAEKIKFTDRGLELEMSKPKKPSGAEAPPLPEKRKF